MKRVALILVAAIAAIAWAVGPASGADKTVTANTTNRNQPDEDNFYSPKTVTILAGDTVTWQNKSGIHNVVLKYKGDRRKLGGDPITHTSTDTRWTASFTFPDPGTYNYFCEEHADPDGTQGMLGKVIVQGPNGDTTAPKITNLRAKPKNFCTNKSEGCDKRGTKIKFTLSEDAKVKGHVRPANGKTLRQIFNKQRAAGKNTIGFKGKDMKPGNYVLRLVATDAAGNKSAVATANMKVKQEG